MGPLASAMSIDSKGGKSIAVGCEKNILIHKIKG